MIPLTPALLVAAGNAFVAPSRDNGGATFVGHLGYWSHFDHLIGKSAWPLPEATDSCVLGEFARQAGVLSERPHEGDVFLKYSPEVKQFVREGVVLSVVSRRPVCVCTTIERNSIGAVVGRMRRFGAEDRFIRWVELT